jgi:hypothetical protein
MSKRADISKHLLCKRLAAMAAPSGKLLSDDKATAAKIADWCAFADTEIASHHGVCQGMIAGYFAYAKPVSRGPGCRVNRVMKG